LKNSNEQTLNEVIRDLLKVYKLEDGLNETRVIGSWENIAGSLIHKHTQEIYIKKKKLYIKLDSPALKHELSFAKTKLIKALNKSVNQETLEDIIFL
jgi:hypothetical protein